MVKMTEKRPEIRSWRRIALPASLVLNFFLIALIGGHLLRYQIDDVGPATSLLARALADAEASLSAPDAAAFGAVIRRDAPRYAEAGQQLADARDVLEHQIVAEPFNQAAVRQAFATWHASQNHFFDNFSSTLVEALAQVSPEGRQKLVVERRRMRTVFRVP
jgi:uncharacterized membrane protein